METLIKDVSTPNKNLKAVKAIYDNIKENPTKPYLLIVVHESKDQDAITADLIANNPTLFFYMASLDTIQKSILFYNSKAKNDSKNDKNNEKTS